MAWTKGNPPPTAWKKGQSGNPAGFAFNVRAEARRRYGEGAQVLFDWLDDFRDGKIKSKVQRVTPKGDLEELEVEPAPKERLEAALASLAYHSGRPAQAIDVNTTSTSISVKIDPNQLSDEEIEWAERISRKARGEMQGEPVRAELPPAQVEGGSAPTSAPDAARVIAGEPMHGSASRGSGEK